MTGVTLRFQFFAVGVFHMATFAAQFPMTPTQREFRILVVIELCCRPGFRRMAILALRTVSAFVCVVTAMTRHTLPVQLLLIQNSPVTASARRIPVLSLQRKTGFCMVETDALP
jgi:hypothetical protein